MPWPIATATEHNAQSDNAFIVSCELRSANVPLGIAASVSGELGDGRDFPSDWKCSFVSSAALDV